jgi:hypothetical protein
MAITHRLFLPPSFGGILKVIASFSDGDFEILAADLNGPDSFDLDRRRCARIAKVIGTDIETTVHIVQFCGYLYGQIHSRDVTASELPVVVGSLLDTYSEFANPDQRDAVLQRMCSVLERRESAATFRKTQRLRVGFLRNALNFSSLVDLRPDFSDDKKSVQRLVPVAQLRISTDDHSEDFKDIVIQLDERSLARLKETLGEMEQKFTTLQGGSMDAPVTKMVMFE